MATERYYIYRNGITADCAITGTKNDPRLMSVAGCWRFWMQIGRPQAENAGYGLDMVAALADIAFKGYFFFTGSQKLLGVQLRAPSPGGRTANE
jgi:hypothetical protein